MTVPAVRLAALATRLRDLADQASPGPWVATCMGSEGHHVHEAEASEGIRRKRVALCTYEKWETDTANAAFIATMNPSVALALADLVDAAVNDHAAIYEADCYCREGATCDNLDALLPLADLILGPEGTA